jgi:hypothetical protein
LTWEVLSHTLDRYGDDTLTPRQQLVSRFLDREARAIFKVKAGASAADVAVTPVGESARRRPLAAVKTMPTRAVFSNSSSPVRKRVAVAAGTAAPATVNTSVFGQEAFDDFAMPEGPVPSI